MNRFWTIFLTILLCSHLTAVLGQKIEIPLLDKYAKDVNKWVDSEGFTVIQVSLNDNDHYFYLIDPSGYVLAEYKNYFLSIYNKGYSSNQEEFTIYFSRTAKGKIEFLNFFKDGTRAPLLTTWGNEPKDYFNAMSINGNFLFMNYSKKKEKFELVIFDGPVNENSKFEFDIESELAKEIIREDYLGIDLDKIYEPHYGAGLAFLENAELTLLKPGKEGLNLIKFSLGDLKITRGTFPYPNKSQYFGTKNDAFLIDDRIFLLTIDMNRLCLDILNLELDPIKSICYGKDENLELKVSPVVNREGKNMDEKWGRSKNITAKILNEMFAYSSGYISVLRESNGDYSLKIGSENKPKLTPNPLPGTSGLITSQQQMSYRTELKNNSARSLSFNASLTSELGIKKGLNNYFEKVFDKTEIPIFDPNIEWSDVIVHKNFFYFIRYNRKDSKLEIERFTFD